MNGKMGKRNIARQLSVKFGFPVELAEDVIDEVFFTIFSDVLQGRRVTIRGFGVFYPVLRKGRKYNVPKVKGKMVEKGDRIKIGFKASNKWIFEEGEFKEITTDTDDTVISIIDKEG